MGETEIDKCVDEKTGVIDKQKCYLIPRAKEQFKFVTKTNDQSLMYILGKCYDDHLTKGNYTTFYQCLVTEDFINSKTIVYPFSPFSPHVKTLG